MSGGKKKKSTGKAAQKKTEKPEKTEKEVNAKEIVDSKDTSKDTVKTTAKTTSTTTTDGLGGNPSVDVLDRLAPPILFFPPNVSEEYLNRFCPSTESVPAAANPSGLLADEGFPDREIPVMRRLLAMMAGIMSKASAAAARTYYSRVAGSEGRRNGYFQQNLNTSVFNLFSTLSAAGTETNISNSNSANSADLHLTPAGAFTAKDGEPLRGYPTRLMKFWRQLSPEEQLRLVKEEHAALTNSWIESRQNWCLCAHCKHRRMTISDLTDCLYQTYCEELEAFIASNGQGSTLYSPNLTNSMDPAAKARRFLFKSLSVVGEQALLPRYNQFILRLEAFSSMAFNQKDGTSLVKPPAAAKDSMKVAGVGLKNGLKSAALQASKEFLQKHGKNAVDPIGTELMNESFLLDPESFRNPNNLSFKLIHDSDDEDCILLDKNLRQVNYSDDDDDEDASDAEPPHEGGIQSEDDDDLIDEETDLPIDESELMLPGGASFPLLPAGDGPVQWSESSRIECGRTVFLMFASEMFQYRLVAAHLSHQTRLRQLKLLAEVEAEERVEKEKRAKLEREMKEKAEAEKKRKAAKREKAAAKATGKKPAKPSSKTVTVTKKPSEPVKTESETEVEVIESETPEYVIEPETEIAVEPESDVVAVEAEPVAEPILSTTTTPSTTTPITATINQKEESVFDNLDPIIPPTTTPTAVLDDDFDLSTIISQLSQEIQNFELNTVHSKSQSQSQSHGNSGDLPPGFAPPPGFVPKHLDESVGNNNAAGFVRPPFSMNSEGYYNSGYNSGYNGGYQGVHSHPIHHHQQPEHYNTPPYPYNPSYHQGYQHPSPYHGQPANYAFNSHNAHPAHHGQTGYTSPPHPPPFYHHHQQQHPNQNHPYSSPAPPPPEETEEGGGQSRFQSFFSKSIFGPSSFFQ